MIRFSKLTLTSILAFGMIGMTACSIGDVHKEQVAMRLASPAWMVKRPIEQPPFLLTAFERMHERGEAVHVYIEGSGALIGEDLNAGLAKSLKDTDLFDATPRNPVALHLASKDKADNLAYLARPCQYDQTDNPFTYADDYEVENCAQYWGAHQFDAVTLDAYQTVLNGIKNRYGANNVHLIGYDSGATLAALLAGSRNDVMSLRTVAGDFDLAALQPIMAKLKHLPQHHFIGGKDTITPPAELHSYLQALGPSECVDYTLIQEAEHDAGYVDKWPELLKEKPPLCVKPPMPEFVPIEKPDPIYVPRMPGSKK